MLAASTLSPRELEHRLAGSFVTTENANIVELENVSKRYGGVVALDNISLTLRPGEVHCLAGENGSGKSTLVKIISGVEKPAKGSSIALDGTKYSSLTTAMSTSHGIHVIYQDLALFPNLSVGENISFAHNRGIALVDRSKLHALAKRTLGQIGAKLDLDAEVTGLSIAGRQLVAICRALSSDARVLIMDEPTASLNPREINSLLRIVSELKTKGICIVFVSHKLEEVLSVSDRVTVLRDGRKVGTYDAAGMTASRLSALMTGKEFRYQPVVGDFTGRKTVFEAVGLCRVGEFKDISFAVREGEILGITGPMGAGKTELAHTVFGMTPPDKGVMRVDGRDVRFRSNRDAIARGICYVPEDRLTLGLVMQQSIAANILVAVYDRLATVFGVLRHNDRKDVVTRWVNELAIKTADPSNAVNTLSGGNQQRVVLAKWIARSPRVLILDSPTVGVDVNAKDGIYSIVNTLAERGVAVIVISDELSEVFYHTHRVIVMREGQVTKEVLCASSSEKEISEAVHA